jgi:hypothetical protein
LSGHGTFYAAIKKENGAHSLERAGILLYYVISSEKDTYD